MTTTKKREPDLIPMWEAVRNYYQPGRGRHWFDADSMRFFKSRLPEYGMVGADRAIYFVSSEQGPTGPRAYSVRVIRGPGDIETVGAGFMGYATRAQALGACKRLALAV